MSKVSATDSIRIFSNPVFTTGHYYLKLLTGSLSRPKHKRRSRKILLHEDG